MLEGQILIVNPLGLHARAAAQLVKVAGRYSSSVTLQRKDVPAQADGKSMLDVLTLAAPADSVLTVLVDGDDEVEALEAIRHLFASGFGEILRT